MSIKGQRKTMKLPTDAREELEAILRGPPSRLAFRALCALLDTLPAGELERGLRVAEEELAKWPDADRCAPWSWCRSLAQGRSKPTWRLVRSLDLESSHLTKGDVALRDLVPRPEVRGVTELRLPTYSDNDPKTFLNHFEVFPNLTRFVTSDADVGKLASLAVWKQVRQLHLGQLTASLFHSGPPTLVPDVGRESTALEAVTLPAADLVALLSKSSLPHLQSAAVFVRNAAEAKKLARRPELKQLRSLSLAFRCGRSGSSPLEPFLGNVIREDEKAANVFFKKAKLHRLERLTIHGHAMGYWGREGLGPGGLDRLIRCGLLKQLTQLRLELLPLGDEGIARLVPELPRGLRSLELPNVYFKDAGADVLSRAPCLESLEVLDLSANRMSPDGACRLAAAALPKLTKLNLSGPSVHPYYWDVGQQPLQDSGIAAWVESANAAHLRELVVKNTFMTDEGLRTVSERAKLAELEELDISHATYTDDGLAALARSPLWKTLRILRMADCRIGDAGIAALVRVEEAPRLRSLDLGYNSIGPEGAGLLAGWKVLSGVWELNLHDNFVGDEGLIALARSPNLTRLLELDLEQDCWNMRHKRFGLDAATALAESSALPRLEAVFSGCVDEYHGCAYTTGFSEEGLQRLLRNAWGRPEAEASLSDFSGVVEEVDFDEDSPEMKRWESERKDHDFRSHPRELQEDKGEPNEHRMQQVPYPTG